MPSLIWILFAPTIACESYLCYENAIIIYQTRPEPIHSFLSAAEYNHCISLHPPKIYFFYLIFLCSFQLVISLSILIIQTLFWKIIQIIQILHKLVIYFTVVLFIVCIGQIWNTKYQPMFFVDVTSLQQEATLHHCTALSCLAFLSLLNCDKKCWQTHLVFHSIWFLVNPWCNEKNIYWFYWRSCQIYVFWCAKIWHSLINSMHCMARKWNKG